MSNPDHLVIKRAVRSVLARSLSLQQDTADRTADEVMSALRFECGGDRLYVPRGKAHADRDSKIRDAYRDLCGRTTQRIALETLARREELSIRQLRRICAPGLLHTQATCTTRQ